MLNNNVAEERLLPGIKIRAVCRDCPLDVPTAERVMGCSALLGPGDDSTNQLTLWPLGTTSLGLCSLPPLYPFPQARLLWMAKSNVYKKIPLPGIPQWLCDKSRLP